MHVFLFLPVTVIPVSALQGKDPTHVNVTERVGPRRGAGGVVQSLLFAPVLVTLGVTRELWGAADAELGQGVNTQD